MVAGTIKANTVFETDHVLAFRDIHPQAPTQPLFLASSKAAAESAAQPLVETNAKVATPASSARVLRI